jgi:hypothetical protein
VKNERRENERKIRKDREEESCKRLRDLIRPRERKREEKI